jgi:hypothetical protein
MSDPQAYQYDEGGGEIYPPFGETWLQRVTKVHWPPPTGFLSNTLKSKDAEKWIPAQDPAFTCAAFAKFQSEETGKAMKVWIAVSSSGSFYRSTDDGQHWTLIYSVPMVTNFFGDIAVVDRIVWGNTDGTSGPGTFVAILSKATSDVGSFFTSKNLGDSWSSKPISDVCTGDPWVYPDDPEQIAHYTQKVTALAYGGKKFFIGTSCQPGIDDTDTVFLGASHVEIFSSSNGLNWASEGELDNFSNCDELEGGGGDTTDEGGGLLDSIMIEVQGLAVDDEGHVVGLGHAQSESHAYLFSINGTSVTLLGHDQYEYGPPSGYAPISEVTANYVPPNLMAYGKGVFVGFAGLWLDEINLQIVRGTSSGGGWEWTPIGVSSGAGTTGFVVTFNKDWKRVTQPTGSGDPTVSKPIKGRFALNDSFTYYFSDDGTSWEAAQGGAAKFLASGMLHFPPTRR